MDGPAPRAWWRTACCARMPSWSYSGLPCSAWALPPSSARAVVGVQRLDNTFKATDNKTNEFEKRIGEAEQFVKKGGHVRDGGAGAAQEVPRHLRRIVAAAGFPAESRRNYIVDMLNAHLEMYTIEREEVFTSFQCTSLGKIKFRLAQDAQRFLTQVRTNSVMTMLQGQARPHQVRFSISRSGRRSRADCEQHGSCAPVSGCRPWRRQSRAAFATRTTISWPQKAGPRRRFDRSPALAAEHQPERMGTGSRGDRLPMRKPCRSATSFACSHMDLEQPMLFGPRHSPRVVGQRVWGAADSLGRWLPCPRSIGRRSTLRLETVLHDPLASQLCDVRKRGAVDG